MEVSTQQSLAENDSNGTDKVRGQSYYQSTRAIVAYLQEESATFRELRVLKELGWSNKAGDTYFRRQRQKADKNDEETAKFFYVLMKRIGRELQQNKKVFTIARKQQTDTEPPRILDMCMAPGGFLATALRQNPTACTLAFSLPVADGGHKVLLPEKPNVEKRLLDITMLAADMGMKESDDEDDEDAVSDDGTRYDAAIPPGHPDAGNFVRTRQIPQDQLFDLVLCDGQTLRTHARAPYREAREARRLSATQLALGLEHLRPGGTMVALLHQLEAWDTVNLLHTFRQFAKVRLFKPKTGHTTRSSFYMIASAVQSRHPEAVRAVARWKKVWRTATFGTDEEYWEVVTEHELDVDQVLAQFGQELVRLGRSIWQTQADALSKAPYIRDRLRMSND